MSKIETRELDYVMRALSALIRDARTSKSRAEFLSVARRARILRNLSSKRINAAEGISPAL